MKITKLCYYQDITKLWEVCGVDKNNTPSRRQDVLIVKCYRKEGGNEFQQENSVYVDNYNQIYYGFLLC